MTSKGYVPVLYGGLNMEILFNYDSLFKQALQKVKCVRNPHASKPESSDLMWDVVREQVLFDFCGSEHVKYERVISAAKRISLSCLNFIILQLGKKYHCGFESVEVPINKNKQSEIYFAIKDGNNDCVLLFKELEECIGWKIKDEEPENIKHFLEKNGVSKCKYVYMVYDSEYLQIIGHNQDESDPGRGYNIYGVKWFIESYFSEREYVRFHESLANYIKEVNDYIGYIYTKTLSSTALINFRKIVKHNIDKFDYDVLLQKKIKGKDANGREKIYTLKKADYEIIEEQYFVEKISLIILGKHDFAESLITAEWLYSSMKQAKAIDLTVIGMGYFKAVEQLLYELICLHKNEGRLIKKNSSKDMVKLSDININKKDYINSTLGSMATFYKENIDMFRDEIESKEYIRETIFAYARIRNGYFHKHNIHSWDKIDEIRKETFYLIFLLLGAHKLSDEEKINLGQPSIEIFDDYYKLCEYVNYHSNELFYINLGQNDEMAIAHADMFIETVDSNYIKYSGVYFKEFREGGRIFKFSKDHLPKAVYTGKFIFEPTDLVKGEPVKVEKIFENGNFIGPSIVDEDKFTY